MPDSGQSVLVNGRRSEDVSALDRGFAFGDGVFRTIRCVAGRPLNWTRHLERLRADCATLALEAPGEELLLAEVSAVAPRDATVKIVVTRGASGRGYAMPGGVVPTRVVAAFPPPAYPEALGREGVAVRRCRLVLSEQPRYAGAKTLNRLENVMARSEWTDSAIHEGLIADAKGRVIEGTMSNVFVARAGRVATPGLARCGVVGAQRERVRDFLREEGLECAERDIGWDELEAADEVFLTNSLIGVWPVARLEGRTMAPGPIARRMRQRVEANDAKGV